MRDYLVYTSAGRAANVRQWFLSAHRNYDIWITNYTDTTALNREYADYYNAHPGSKFQNLKTLYDKHQAQLRNYKAIMVADDDIIISPTSLSALFTLLTDKDLWILQPAFSRFGKISHRITRRRLTTSLRYTNFVEVTCPMFRTDKLLDFLSIYRPELSSCYGIDWWFLNHLRTEHTDKIAISDTHYCINPLDRFKPGGRRQIDFLNTHEERISMWLTIKRETGIDSFDHQEFRRLPKGIIALVFSVPMFATEIIFNKTLIGIRKCLYQ
mgnify:CR=1 FL=1